MKSYAQNMEDLLLHRVFGHKRSGFYIDIGAHDPTELSVTKLFYDLGWYGINIEPLPQKIEKFQLRRPRDININVAIGDTRGEAPFYEVKGLLRSGIDASALSSFSQDIVLGAQATLGIEYQLIDVHTDLLSNICRKHILPDQVIDFLKIDTEGHELKVLQSADFTRYRPTVLLIEIATPNSNTLEMIMADKHINTEELDGFLKEKLYIPAYDDGLNRFYLAQEAESLQPRFSIPVGVFDGVFLPGLFHQIEDLKSQIVKLESALEERHT